MLESIYEDNHLLVINKPAGMLAQGDRSGDRSAIDEAKSYIKVKYEKPGNVFLGLCHRLDRPVSGCLIFARTSKALGRMNKLFNAKEVAKTYLAISHRRPVKEQGEIDTFLIKDTRRNLVRVAQPNTRGSKRAVTHYKVLGQREGYWLIELTPVTGRSHQLRVAMRTLKCPILGDIKYKGRSTDDRNIFLHCRMMEFIHPVSGENIQLIASLPDKLEWHYFSDMVQKKE